MKAKDVVQNPRLAGLVKRYHTWPTLREQTVAEHSWQVARIYEKFFGPPSAEVERFIRWHDAGEIATGDLPYPVKSLNPDIKNMFDVMEEQAALALGARVPDLHDEARWRVKLCDLVEMWEFGLEELARGNRFAQPIVDRIEQSVIAHIRKMDARWFESAIWHTVTEHMEEFKRCTT